MIKPVLAVFVLFTTMLIHARLTVNGKLAQNLAQSLRLVSYVFIDYILMLYGACCNCPASHHVFPQ